MKRNLLLLFLPALCPLCTPAQDIDHVLQSIAQNNMQIQADGQTLQADVHQMKALQALEGTEVSYSPFYTSGVAGIASSELVVSQSFDFPTLYAARRKARLTATEQMEWQHEALRQDVMLQARLLCLQVIFLRKSLALTDRHIRTMTTAERLYDEMLNRGAATLIDTNKIRLECARLATNQAQLQNSLQQTLLSLKALNGGHDVTLTQSDYPATEPLADEATIMARYMATDAALKASIMATDAERRQVQVSRMEKMPRLAVGYRRNTEMKEARNGFLVGATLPLFTGRHKIKEALMRHEAQATQTHDQQAQVQAQVQSLLEERRILMTTLAQSPAALADSTLAVLHKATQKGRLTAIQYCQEAEAAYSHLSLCEENLYRLQCVEAMLRKGEN